MKISKIQLTFKNEMSIASTNKPKVISPLSIFHFSPILILFHRCKAAETPSRSQDAFDAGLVTQIRQLNTNKAVE